MGTGTIRPRAGTAFKTPRRDNWSISSANVDLVRSIYARWERGDFSSAECADPEIEILTADGPEPSRGTGLSALARFMRVWLSAWEDFHSARGRVRRLIEARTALRP